MSLPGEPHLDTLSEIARTAHLLGFVVIANRRHTDLFEWGQRSTPFTLPAEIQRRLLPAAYTCEGARCCRRGWSPRRTSVATPSTTASAATCCTCQSRMRWVTAWLAPDRHLVRGEPAQHAPPGASLLEQAAAANTALSEYAPGVADDAYATGLLGRLELRSGALTLVNAGHDAPYLARAGQVTPIQLPSCMPLGLFADQVLHRQPDARAW